MSNVFEALFLVALIGLIVGFVRPSVVLRWSQKRTRRSVVVWYGIPALIFLMFTGATAPKQDQPTTANSDPRRYATYNNNTTSNNTSSKTTNSTSNNTTSSAKNSVTSSKPPAPPSMKQVSINAVHHTIAQSNLMKNGDAFLGVIPGNSSEPYIIEVEAEDNLTHNMVKNGILMDTTTIIQDIFKDKRFNDVMIDWFYPNTDAYGNTTNAIAEKIEFKRSTIEQINWDNFLWKNVPVVADDFEVNPAFDSGN